MAKLKIIDLIPIVFLFIGISSFGQDTIVVDDHYLIGTSVLRGSNRNSESCILHGYCFDKIINYPCSSVETETLYDSEETDTLYYPRIKRVTRRNDSLTISLQVYENCGLDFLGEIEIVDNNTLNIILHEYGSFAACMCPFDIDCIVFIESEDVAHPVKIEYVVFDNREYTKLKIEK